MMLALLILFFSFSNPLSAYDLQGTLYEKNHTPLKPLFEYQRNEKKQGDQTRIDTVYRDLEKQIVATETASLSKGQLIKYQVDQKQLNEQGEVQIQGNKLVFNYTKQGKAQQPVSEDKPENFVVALTLMDYLKQHREALLAGKTVEVRYGVLDRMETVGFSIYKIEEKKVGDTEAVVLKMAIGSFLLRLVVNPLRFVLRKSDFRPMEVIGRTLPKQHVDGEWRTLDADLVLK